MRDVRVGVGAVFVGLLLAAGCGSSSSDSSSSSASTTAPDVVIAPDGPPQTGGTLTYGLASESDGWNPTEGRWATDGTQVGMAIFDPLAAYNADGDWAPYLADSFTPNADFTEWTIKLRPDVTFQNGTPFTWNSDLPSDPAGGSVRTTSTRVAPARLGAAMSRCSAGMWCFGSDGSSLNAIVSTSSGMRYSTLP